MVLIDFLKNPWTIVHGFDQFLKKAGTIVHRFFLKKVWTIVHGFDRFFEKSMVLIDFLKKSMDYSSWF